MASRVVAACFFALAISIALLPGATGNFVADWSFKGSALDGWQPLGQADWRAENGEIIGTPRAPDGGWLLLKQSFQDVQLAASVRCAATCAPGLLLRAEALPDGGMKGIFVSYAPDDTGAYAVTIDAQGKITSRERLRPGGGQLRFVANVDGTQPNPSACARVGSRTSRESAPRAPAPGPGRPDARQVPGAVALRQRAEARRRTARAAAEAAAAARECPRVTRIRFRLPSSSSRRRTGTISKCRWTPTCCAAG